MSHWSEQTANLISCCRGEHAVFQWGRTTRPNSTRRAAQAAGEDEHDRPQRLLLCRVDDVQTRPREATKGTVCSATRSGVEGDDEEDLMATGRDGAIHRVLARGAGCDWSGRAVSFTVRDHDHCRLTPGPYESAAKIARRSEHRDPGTLPLRLRSCLPRSQTRYTLHP